jgi:murein DD-endopeptidase MepM/ murein hydrolase activator NlpD
MPDTTSRRLGLTPAERNALILLSGLEAHRGGAGRDIAAVTANVINRRLSGKYPVNILNIAKQPNQYAAVFPYTMQQISDPTFGRRLLGKEYDRVAAVVDNPSLIAQEIKNLRGATEFRGQANLKYKKPEDYMADPRGNFYFNFSPDIQQKGLKLFGSPTQAPTSAAPVPSQNPSVSPGAPAPALFDLKGAIKKFLLRSSIEGLAAPTVGAGAIALQQEADALRDSGNDNAADIKESQVMSSLLSDTQKETGLSPSSLIQGLLDIKLQQREYNNAIEGSSQNLTASQTAQGIGTNAATGARMAQGISYPGAVVTSPRDVTGEPGLDFALAGGRGAMFASPFRAQVLKVVREANSANRGPGGRGYGNYVELRGVTPEGKPFDTLIAHFDQLNPNLRPGMTIEPGTRIGTQGETGRATGPHISMDFFDPGEPSASSDILRLRDIVASRIQKGLSPFG